jgi:hypothetical protein
MFFRIRLTKWIAAGAAALAVAGGAFGDRQRNFERRLERRRRGDNLAGGLQRFRRALGIRPGWI